MKNLNFLGQYFGCLGIPNHTRSFANALIDNVESINLTPILQGQDDYGITPKLTSKFTQPNPSYPSLIFWYPETFPEYFNQFKPTGKKFGYYIFEYNIIPQSRVDILNTLDGVCTASQWGVDTLKKNGVTVPIHVIPGGVDSSIFNSSTRNLDSKRFRFLHMGKAENRKGTSLVIKAFNEAFKGDRKVRLSLFIDNPHLRAFDANMFLNTLQQELGLEHPITNIDVRHFEQDIVSIYNTHHAAVFASKAEGIGLPIVEAMACGLPTIVPYNTGITQYANDNNSILIKGDDLVEEEIFDINFFAVKGEFGTWQSPKVSALADKMKWVYENYEQAQAIGKVAEQDMRENYSWDLSAKKFASIL